MYQKYLPKYLRKSLLKYLREIYLHERKMFYVTKFEERFSANVFVHNKAESSWMPIFTCLLSNFLFRRLLLLCVKCVVNFKRFRLSKCLIQAQDHATFSKNTLHGIAELSPGYNFGISQTKLYYMFCFYLTYSRLLCRHKISFCMCIFKLRECCSKWGSLCYCGNVCVCV